MNQLAGYWWPDTDTRGSRIISRDAEEDIAWFLSLVKGRSCVIQAGGNVGMYPIILADHFQKVLTVEPDDTNFACLKANLAARDSLRRVDARKAAFGEGLGKCKVIEVERDNCGAHRIGVSNDGEGAPILSIDSFKLKPDAIWLDVEGFELQALRGAADTIKKCKPVIVVEQKQLGRIYGYEDREVTDFLEQIGYTLVNKHKNDGAFKCLTV